MRKEKIEIDTIYNMDCLEGLRLCQRVYSA